MEATYEIQLAKDAAAYYDRLSRDKQELVNAKLEMVAHDPTHFPELKHQLKGLRRIRIDPLRILYVVDRQNNRVTVIDISTRDKVYKKPR